MPITKFTPNKLKKTKKDDLIIHILDLYSFTEIFDNKSVKHITKAKLQEENKKLKKDNKFKTDQAKSYVKLVDGMMSCKGGFNDWVEKDKQHNWDNCVIGYFAYLEEEVKNYKDTLDDHFHHYEKLKEEDEKLKEIITHKDNKFVEWSRENKELEEENEKLKIEIEEHGSIIEKLDHRIADVRAENKKLEGLKSHAIEIAAARGIQIDKLEKELYRYKDVPQLGRNYQIASKENKKLKEQIEKIEEEIEKLKNKI